MSFGKMNTNGLLWNLVENNALLLKWTCLVAFVKCSFQTGYHSLSCVVPNYCPHRPFVFVSYDGWTSSSGNCEFLRGSDKTTVDIELAFLGMFTFYI